MSVADLVEPRDELLQRASNWIFMFDPEIPGGMITLQLIEDMRNALRQHKSQ